MIFRNGQALGSIFHAKVDPEAAEPPAPVTEPVSVVETVTEPVPVAEPEPIAAEPVESDLIEPKPYASKADWVDFAVAKGADPDEAAALTRGELADLYGGV